MSADLDSLVVCTGAVYVVLKCGRGFVREAFVGRAVEGRIVVEDGPVACVIGVRVPLENRCRGKVFPVFPKDAEGFSIRRCYR